jgi:16S rRNA processing protein RimM
LPLTDNHERYDSLQWVYIEKDNKLEKYHVENIRHFNKFVLVKFKEVNDISHAESLRELYLKVDRENAVKLPEGRFFISDLIECRVFEEDGNILGKLTDVIQTGSNDVYVVMGENKREILIPALKSVVKEINIEAGEIIVSLPEGLID